MARTINSRRSTRQDEGTKQRDVIDQPTPFIGLIFAPFIALIFCWAIHFAIAGWTWHVGSHTWHVDGSPGFMILAEIVAIFGAGAMGHAAWKFAQHRLDDYREIFTASVVFIGLWLPFVIGYGPTRWLDTFFVICTWIISGIWSLPRTHFLRRDPRDDGQGDADGDELTKQLGLTGYKAKGTPKVAYDENGDVERVEVDIKHRYGGTRKPLQDAIDNLASMLGTKDGFVRVTAPDDGKSNHSIVTAVLKDPFVGRIPALPPSHPGGSIASPAYVGKYDDGLPVYVWIGGGKSPITGDQMPPSGYAFMGMTRAGKTVTENRLLLDGVITRRGVTNLYLNKAKGDQDVQPIIAGIEAAVISDANSEYEYALARVVDICNYRKKQLGRYGISAHTPDKAFWNPPKHYVSCPGTGKCDCVPMEPMPTLVVHVGEADAILETAGEVAVYLASKGLSLGIIMGWSLQRWSSYSMPTDLRFNIGTAFCFGVGDDYSAGFALSEQTIKAGAHPEYWKNRKPGMFYVENIGIEENRFPVPAKGVGDTDDDALYTNMRLTAEQYGPQMDRLDRGSAGATRGWWDKQVRITDALRASMTPTAQPATVPDDPTPTQEDTMRRTPAAYAPPAFTADPPTADQDADTMSADEETRSDIANTVEINGEPILGGLIKPDRTDGSADGEAYYDEIHAANPAVDPPTPDGNDGVHLDDGKPEAPTRQDAELAFDEAVRAAAADPRFKDREDPTGRSSIIRTGQLQEFFKFRARSWYSPILAQMADGERICPPGIRVERMRDRSGDGWYRLVDTAGEENT